jgi:hypothetical protein
VGNCEKKPSLIIDLGIYLCKWWIGTLGGPIPIHKPFGW